MATSRANDLKLEQIYLERTKIKLYVRQDHIDKLTKDANELGLNRSTLLEMLFIKYLSRL
jgi:hypothetical protein